MKAKKIDKRKQIEIITNRDGGRRNSCYGFCIECHQSEVKYQSSEKADVFFYYCGLPVFHNIRLK